MDLRKLWQLVVRQRWVVAVMVVVSIGALVFVYVSAPPLYRASGSLVLFNPPRAPEANEVVPTTAIPGVDEGPTATTLPGENPYARFNDLSIVSDVLVRRMQSPRVADELSELGLVGTFSIGANANFYRGPIIDLAAEASTPEQAVTNVELVMEELNLELATLQDERSVEPAYRITTAPVVEPENATRVFSSTLRRLIGVTALCGVATIALALLFDSFGRRRGRGQDDDQDLDGRADDSTDENEPAPDKPSQPQPPDPTPTAPPTPPAESTTKPAVPKRQPRREASAISRAANAGGSPESSPGKRARRAPGRRGKVVAEEQGEDIKAWINASMTGTRPDIKPPESPRSKS